MATPLCPYFGTCGGCSLQHLAYETQVEQKKQALARAIKVEQDLHSSLEIKVFTGKEYFYRNRMDVLFSPQGLGLRKKGKPSEIVPIDHCVIANETLNILLHEARNFFTPSRIQSSKNTLSSLIIRATSLGDTGLCFMLHENSLYRQEAIALIRDFTPFSSAKNIAVAFVSPLSSSAFLGEEILIMKGTAMLQEKFLNKIFSFHITGFFQNNSALADSMHQYCRELLQNSNTPEFPLAKAHLLDLYAGAGTFGLLNADIFKSVIIVEGSPLAVKAAELNAQNLQIKNTAIHKLDALRLRKIILPKFLCVIADPPRTGMHQQTIASLNQAQPEVIIYISCNAQRLAKELPKFKGYLVQSAALFDFFPQTSHSEAVVTLKKINK